MSTAPKKVIRVSRLYEYLGYKSSQIDELVKKGLLHPFALYSDARVKVVTEEEVAALQASAMAAPPPVLERYGVAKKTKKKVR